MRTTLVVLILLLEEFELTLLLTPTLFLEVGHSLLDLLHPGNGLRVTLHVGEALSHDPEDCSSTNDGSGDLHDQFECHLTPYSRPTAQRSSWSDAIIEHSSSQTGGRPVTHMFWAEQNSYH